MQPKGGDMQPKRFMSSSVVLTEEYPDKDISDTFASEHLFQRALDFCRVPMFIVGSHALLLHANEAGNRLLGSVSCVRLAGGHIAASNHFDTKKLLSQINRVANVLGQQPARGGCVLSGPGEERWALLAFPLLDDFNVPQIRDEAAALLLLVPLDRTDVPALKGILTEFFGLTSAEERVALQIASGRSSADVAKTLDLSIPTVRTHLSRIYQKTGTAFQAQLVLLLHALAIFGWPHTATPSVPMAESRMIELPTKAPSRHRGVSLSAP